MDASNSSTSMHAGGMDAAACSNTEKEAPWTARNSQAGAVASGAAKAGTADGMTATTIANVTALQQDIEDGPVLIHRLPQIVALTPDGKKHFIHMPLVARPWTATTEVRGRLLAKFTAPSTAGFIRNDYAAFK